MDKQASNSIPGFEMNIDWLVSSLGGFYELFDQIACHAD